MIVYLVCLLYLLIGVIIFKEAVNGLGGKENYLEEISNNYNGNPNVAFYIAFVLVMIV